MDREARRRNKDVWDRAIAPRLRAVRELEPPPRLRERIARMIAAGVSAQH